MLNLFSGKWVNTFVGHTNKINNVKWQVKYLHTKGNLPNRTKLVKETNRKGRRNKRARVTEIKYHEEKKNSIMSHVSVIGHGPSQCGTWTMSVSRDMALDTETRLEYKWHGPWSWDKAREVQEARATGGQGIYTQSQMTWLKRHSQ